MKNIAVSVIAALCIAAPVFSQADDWEEVLEYLLDDEEISSEYGTVLAEELSYLHENRMDINSASATDLSALPFLSLSQIADIRDYIVRYGNMKTLAELQLAGIDIKTRSLLSHFVYAGDGKYSRPIDDMRTEKWRSELMVKADAPLYLRAGFGTFSDEELAKYPNRKYLGDRYSHGFRYVLEKGSFLKFGLAGDKDAGEPFLDREHPGYDFLSAYLTLNFQNVSVVGGNLKAGFGQGLVLNTGFSMGKTMSASGLDRPMGGIKGKASASEYGYLTGLGVTVQCKPFSISGLVSYTGTDATFDRDSLISSFKTDGYHRTPAEMSKRRNVHESLAALHLDWKHEGMTVGATALYDAFDHAVAASDKEYKKYDASGSRFWNASADFSLFRPGLSVTAEVAVCDGYDLAFVAGMKKRMWQKYMLTVFLRSYGKSYHSFHSSSFAEGKVANEQGAYFQLTRNGRLMVTSFSADFFRFPWLRYGVSLPSCGMDFQLRSTWQMDGANTLDFKWRWKLKQQDCKATGYLEFKRTQRMSLRWNHDFSSLISLQSQLSYVRYYFPGADAEDGLSLSECFIFSGPGRKFSGSVSASAFLTDSFSSAVSVYERGLLYSFGFQSLYGKGIRASFVLKYKFTPRLSLLLKTGSTMYADRDVIGSSTQQINSSHKEDLSLQLRCKF